MVDVLSGPAQCCLRHVVVVVVVVVEIVAWIGL